MTDSSTAELLREVKTDPTKCIRFSMEIENGTITAVFTYQEMYGWAMRHPDGREYVWPSEHTVTYAFEIYDTARVVTRGELDD